MEIKGYFYKEIYRDHLTGFCIFTVNAPDNIYANQVGDVKCKAGCLMEFKHKAPVKLTGKYNEKDNIFEVDAICEDVTDKKALVKYITSSYAKIGKNIVENIVRTFNDYNELLREDASERLEKAGLAKRMVNDFIDFFTETTIKSRIMEKLSAYDGQYCHMVSLYELYGKDSIRMLEEKPYDTCRKINMSFDAADKIAKMQNPDVKSDSPERVLSVIAEVTDMMEESGDTYWSSNRFIGECSAYHSTVIKDTIPAHIISKRVKEDNPYVYYKEGKFINRYLDECENIASKNLERLCNTNYKEKKLDYQIIKKIELEQKFEFAPQQLASFSLLTSPGVKILTGGPGTGKTSTVDGLIKYYEAENPGCEICLCAPTGRAAQRMSETTGRKAETQHQMLGIKANEKVAKVKELTADLVVADEFSMTDIVMFSLLVSSLKKGATLLIVGDVDQLASVGAGNVLSDLINSHRIPVVKLTDVFRQAQGSDVIMNAKKVNKGQFDLVEGEDFNILYADSDTEVADKCEAILLQEMKEDDCFHVQILSPTRKGVCGSNTMNSRLQNILMESETPKKRFVYGKKTFYVGDKVVMLKNNLRMGYSNGDLGIVQELTGNGIKVKLGVSTVELIGQSLDEVELAYCTTIHKGQGSEYPVVIMMLPMVSPLLLTRELLYTGITRCKAKIYIIAEGNAINIAISNSLKDVHNSVNTLLLEKIQKKIA